MGEGEPAKKGTKARETPAVPTSVRTRRFGLLVFGVLLVALFAGFAIAQGIGRESVPEGDVAIVEEGPDGESTISEAELKRAVLQQAAQSGLKKVPGEDNPKLGEMRTAALGELLDFIWLKGQAEELDLTVNKNQIDEELEKIKEQNFPTPTSYKEFLKTSKLTQADVDKRVELQVLSTRIQETITKEAGVPTDDEVADFYEVAKEAQFTTKPSRDVRIITNTDKAKVEAARKALEKDDSPANWKKAAQKYSSDPTTSAKGGLQTGLTEELLASAGPLKDAVFESDLNELSDPIKYQGNYTLVQVVKLNDEKVQTLEEVRAQISSQLQTQAQKAFFERFVSDYQAKWESRTICAAGFEVERCSNYKGNGHPATASAACYEDDPKEGVATECPSPVIPISPAMPGSVSILEPKGKQLPQRPVVLSTGAETEIPPTGAPPVE